jgi:nucleotide-binding universal stress UspA family protein
MNMTIKRVLAVTDLSVQEAAVVQRASELADARAAALKLVYIPAAEPLAHADASGRLARAARQLQERLELRVRTAVRGGHSLEDIAQEAAGNDLLVVPWRQERTLSAMLRGQPIERLLRSCRCPVLVVRDMPVARYRRILVAVDFGPLAKFLANVADAVEPTAELQLLHVIDKRDETKLRSAEATEQAVRAFRERQLRRAHECIDSLKAAMGARAHDVATIVSRGDPVRETAQQHELYGSDLIVVGSRRRSAWRDFFGAGVSHQVLRWTTSDVLIVPERCATSGRGTAIRRMLDDCAARSGIVTKRTST